MIRKWLKSVLIFLTAILLLLVVLILVLHTGWGKSIVREKVQSYLHEKLETTVAIGSVDYRLPDWIRLKDVLILDRQADTLLNGGSLYVKMSMLKLLSDRVEIGGIELEKVSLHLRRDSNDSVFNYQAILAAFSSEDQVDDETTQSQPLQLSVDHISLKEVIFNLSDKKEKRHFSAYVEKLFCSSRNLDLEKSSFGINEMVTAGIYITISDSSAKTPEQTSVYPTETAHSSLSFDLKKLGIRDLRFSYKNISDKLDLDIELDTLQIDDASLNTATQNFAARKILLNNSAFNYAAWMRTMTRVKEKTVAQEKTVSKWKLSIDAVALNNNAAIYHNLAMPAIKGFDPNHINIKKVNLFSRENKMAGEDFSASIDSLSFVMNERFDLKQLSTKVGLTGNNLQTENLFVHFNQSFIHADGKLDLSSAVGTNKKGRPHYHLKKAVISYADILFFVPAFKNKLPLAFSPSDKIMISGSFKGSLKDLAVQDLNLATSNRLLQLNGKANFHIRGESKIKYDVVLDQLKLGKSLLSPALQKDLQNHAIQLPETVSLSGNLNGSENAITADLEMNSDYGQMLLKGNAGNISNLQHISYSVDLDARDFETGKWIGEQTTLGKLDGKIHIDGEGIQPGKMNMSGKLQLQSFVLNGYQYSNIQLTGGLLNDDFTAKGFIDDQNLGVEINLQGNLSQIYPSVNSVIAIKKADLRALQLSEDSIVLSSLLMIDVRPTNMGGLAAKILADSNIVIKNGKELFVDSVSISGQSEKEGSNIVVNAPFINARLETNFGLTGLPDSINHLKQQLFNMEGLQKMSGSDQRLSLNASITQHELLSAWFPAFQLEQPLTLTSNYNGPEKDSFLLLQVAAPSLKYKNINLEGLSIEVINLDSALAFNCNAGKIRSGTETLLHPSITGRLQNKMLTVAATTEDGEGKEYFALKVSAEKAGEAMVFRFLDDLTINRHNWEVPAGNSVKLLKEGIIIHDLSLANAGQVLSIETRDKTETSPVDIKIDSIDISHLASIASFGDTTIADGKLSATVSIQQPINSWTAITGTINLRGLALRKVPVGDLELHTNLSGDSLQVKGIITGNNRLDFQGNVHLANGGLDAAARLEKIDMALVQHFAKDILSRCSGIIKGDFRITGNINKPQINGVVNFNSTAFAIKELNALYRINDQQLKVDFPELKFDNFTISDSLNNHLTINGAINIGNADQLGLNLQAQTKNFVVLNAPRRQGSTLYGAAIVDATIKMDGTSNAPVIDGNIAVNDKSRVHYLLQSGGDYTKKAKDGILFVNMDTIPALQGEVIGALDDTILVANKSRGMKYNLNLDLSKDAEFRIVINPAANDELVMKGAAQLNTGMDEGGDVAITGVYRLESGYYNMNNQFLREKFMLVKGSTITFNGEPYNAAADIKTEYEVQASSSGLLRVDENEYPDVSKRLPYQVVLNIKGSISKPELTFDIKLKDNVPGITSSMRDLVNDELARLRTDVSELNKQVFSLLIMSRFTVTSNDDVAGGVLDVDAAVKDGITSFLSEAMNQMADDLIKGVDIEVTMKNYETSNSDVSKTDVGVAMSKDLFKDRLQVTIGKNFSMGETNTTYQNNAQHYVPDITTAYKLSRDGRYLLKAHHKNEYSAAVEGYFIETGVSFTIELDYNKFKELFYSSKKLRNK